MILASLCSEFMIFGFPGEFQSENQTPKNNSEENLWFQPERFAFGFGPLLTVGWLGHGESLDSKVFSLLMSFLYS